MDYLGNRELLKQLKTAFLASGTIAPDVVLRCYDWATDEHEGCVVSGFSSKLEQDVLHFLLKSKTPVIMVLARRMYREIPEELKVPLEQGRLLIISINCFPPVACYSPRSQSLRLRISRLYYDGRRDRRQQSLRVAKGVWG